MTSLPSSQIDMPDEPEEFSHPRLEIRVYGEPAPQGSKRHVGHGVMIESSRKVAPWRHLVAELAAAAAREQHWSAADGPVRVTIGFYLPRPPSIPRKRLFPDRKPDLDKLVRSTLDALSGIAYADDARVTDLCAVKRYVGEGQPSGAVIYVSRKSTGTGAAE